MSTTPAAQGANSAGSQSDAPASEAIRDLWTGGLEHEQSFWRKWFETKGWLWPHEYARRVDPVLEFQPHLRRFVHAAPGSTVRVLDVGAGPLTVLGKVWPGILLELTPVDPLAAVYDAIMRDVGVTPLVRTVHAEAERLGEKFAAGTFDLVYALNCLDHSYDPVAAIRQMVSVCKPGCWVVMEHHPDEAEHEHYQGLHQWNFRAEGDRMIIWRPGTRVDVQEALGNAARLEVTPMPGNVFVAMRVAG